MTSPSLVVVLAMTLGVLGLARPVYACSCIDSGAPCRGLAQAKAVFVGRVTALSLPVGPPGTLPARVTMEVTEAFSGINKGTVDLANATSESECGYSFVSGEQYLVYAFESPTGDLYTTICSRTRLLAKADEDVTYFRSFASPPSEGRLTGRAFVLENDPAGRPSRTALPDVRIVASDGATVRQTTTDVRGFFELKVPVGTYTIRPFGPAGYYPSSTWRVVELRDSRACTDTTIVFRHEGDGPAQVNTR